MGGGRLLSPPHTGDLPNGHAALNERRGPSLFAAYSFSHFINGAPTRFIVPVRVLSAIRRPVARCRS